MKKEIYYTVGQAVSGNTPKGIQGHRLKNGFSQWWLDGRLHRLDGPAVQHHTLGFWQWFAYGKRHRVDGPAIYNSNGQREWYINGELSRCDGPAVIHANGDVEWWLGGVNLNSYDIEAWAKENKIDISTEEGSVAFKLTWME